MTKTTKTYREAIKNTRRDMGFIEGFASKVLHQPVVALTLNALEKTLFRIVPMQFGLVASIAIGALTIFVAYSYGYQLVSLSVLGYVFVLGYTVGLVFQYVSSIISQSK